jgi:glycosyltransferase involved in cell wall biosynthesis
MIIPLHFISSGKVNYMENSIKLSIIVPVYKTEQYLRKCLSSILDQDVDKSQYEVIIVNDGSPDNSQTIIDEYCAKYDNVSCLVQTNQGLSMARNNGVSKAQGEYIWFIDSDDWVDSQSLSCILAECQYDPDLISISKVGSKKCGVGSATVMSGRNILQTCNFEFGAVYYVYNREFLRTHSLEFVSGIYHEDCEFTPRSLYYAKIVRIIATPLYNVYCNAESITRTVNPKKSYDLLFVAESLSKFRDERVAEPEIKLTFDHILSIIVNNSLANIVHSDICEQRKFNDVMYGKRYIQSALWRTSLKYRVEYILFKVFPRHCVEGYKVMKLFA